MADPTSYRPRTGEIPTTPGVYRFIDPHGRVVYVGKAKNLRARLNSYFARVNTLHPKTYAMVHAAASVEWTVVGSELEAIQLEYTWIKQHTPRFNIMYRDDKSYPYLAVTMNEKYPRVQVMRGDKKPGVKYFGPFYPAKAIRETVDTMLRVFPVRSCSAGVFKRAKASGRPCLLGYIGKCAAPCVGEISEEDHRKLAEEFCEVMAGRPGPQVRRIENEMKAAVAELRYEDAGRHRDDLEAIRRVFERNSVVLSEDTEADIFAFAEDELEAAAQVFHVRQGRIRGQRGWVVEKVEDTDAGAMVEQLLMQVYGSMADTERIPPEVLVPALPDNAEEMSAWLRQLRSDSGEGKAQISLRVPQRGDKAALLGTVQENASQALALHKARRNSDITTRSAALRDLQEALGASEPLLRIECFDISHTSGTNVVASMVVLEDGLAKKRDYRRFSVKGDAARDDTSAMYDVIRRRFARHLKDQAQSETAVAEPAEGAVAERAAVTPAPEGAEFAAGEAKDSTVVEREAERFAYPPSLVVVDGGQPQVNVARQALDDLGITDLPVVGLAKRLEEVWLPGDDFPLVLPRSSEALYMLQRIRDEAHRFAIAYHRSKRSKAMTASALDEVPGLGPARRAAVVAHFGSVANLKKASLEEIIEVPGLGRDTAQKILDHLTAEASAAEPSPAEPSPAGAAAKDQA
ncbi:excinuclease ABC subunit UvrC [Nesterenkonia sp. E16_7]|uniref:excinuclease ABC subunit UvrC n=1 Tax=unclassified Nesterenkonia TaxID=2629769 RepID=UPI001A93376A|nr:MULTISPECIES: excinuclease ABC subunit UvrC [unclassified Nesterenkonia]MBO0594567.1 excinuclease ABC subunit UvrC [Nesterenkonia sp. E16_10]MBO0599760.1 excinuclease ABC subunit UvrC [Nesterenkonia sp. E16_7]